MILESCQEGDQQTKFTFRVLKKLEMHLKSIVLFIFDTLARPLTQT